MIQDMDGEMERRNIHGIVATGETTHADPDLTYLVGTFLARGCIYAKRRRGEEALIVSNIDVGSARNGRVERIETYSDYEYEKLASEHGRYRATLLLIERILKAKGINGNIALYGRNDDARTINLSDDLRKVGITIVGERSPTLLEAVRETKAPDEIRKIRDTAKRTQKVIESVLSFLRRGKIRGRRLLAKGDKVTVGDVKRRIEHALVDEGIRDPEGTIFAIGRSSADPHNMGVLSQQIRVGEPIIFDIFPQAASAYWYDITRTYVLGRPKKSLRLMHEAVLEAQETCLDKIRAGGSAREVAEVSYNIVERHGFPSVRSLLKGDQRARTTGYIHGLGHGVGLTIGERPYLSIFSEETLADGHVVTVEPGVYDPHLGGVRIEDTIFVTSSGLSNPARLPKDLEI